MSCPFDREIMSSDVGVKNIINDDGPTLEWEEEKKLHLPLMRWTASVQGNRASSRWSIRREKYQIILLPFLKSKYFNGPLILANNIC